MSGLRRLAWSVLVLNVAVILLGALVRATGSGAGCGRSWPVCRGELIPPLAGATAIEFSHRVASGLALAAVLALAVGVVRRTETGHPARRSVGLAVLAITGEALIGAAIVAFEWVADDSSIARTVAVPLHLVNTLLLLAALTVTTSRLGETLVVGARSPSPIRPRRVPAWAVWGGGGLVMVAALGAVAALADTLFPAESLTAGIGADWAPAQHFLTRLRVLHPVVAVLVSGALAATAARRLQSSPAKAVLALVVIQVFAGFANVVLLTPVWMQLVHLGIADALWVAWVLLAIEAPASSKLDDQDRVAAGFG